LTSLFFSPPILSYFLFLLYPVITPIFSVKGQFLFNIIKIGLSPFSSTMKMGIPARSSLSVPSPSTQSYREPLLRQNPILFHYDELFSASEYQEHMFFFFVFGFCFFFRKLSPSPPNLNPRLWSQYNKVSFTLFRQPRSFLPNLIYVRFTPLPNLKTIGWVSPTLPAIRYIARSLLNALDVFPVDRSAFRPPRWESPP